MKRMFGAAAAVLALTLGSACGGNEQSPWGPGISGTAEGEMRVQVENNNWYQVVVKAVSGAGAEQRLGEVETTGTRTFVVPGSVSTMGVRFLIDPIGSEERYLSPEVTPRQGMLVNLRVENNLQLSTVTVR